MRSMLLSTVQIEGLVPLSVQDSLLSACLFNSLSQQLQNTQQWLWPGRTLPGGQQDDVIMAQL